MKYSVFGGTGFIGGHFSKYFPHKVTVQNRDERFPETKNILYFISTVDNYNVFDNICLDVDTNLRVLCEVLENCKAEGTVFNFISSWFVYGDVSLPAKEDCYCRPSGFYSITKKAAEDLIISFSKTFGINYRILRLCNVLGPFDQGVSAKKNAITYMVDLLKKDEDVFLYNSGTPTRDIMHVEDVCSAIDIVCSKAELNGIYNIGSGNPTTIGYVIEMAKNLLNSSSTIYSKSPPDFHKIVQVENFWMDTSKLKQLGFVQTISTNSIIQELCHQ